MGASAPPGPLGEPPALASEATDGLQYELGVSTPWPHVRRLSDRRIAVQTTEGGRWLVLEAAAPINVRFIEELEVPDDAEWLD